MFVVDFRNGFVCNFTLNEERTELNIDGVLQDRIANGTDEIKPHIFGHGFGGITDIEVGLDEYLYVLSLYQGGNNCAEGHGDCIEHKSEVQGTIFRIIPKNEQ